jgi:tRNA threonylcarbamoyladenosine biosynthesis protein TsaE
VVRPERSWRSSGALERVAISQSRGTPLASSFAMLVRVDDLAGTHAVAAALAGLARAGDVIVLAGAMGTGKTAFAQGFGSALGVTEPITSPTFTLVHSYPCGKLTLHHADLYRLDTTADVDELALLELASFDGIVLVEWGDVASAGFGDHLEVRLSHPDDIDRDADQGDADEFADDGVRDIELSAVGASWASRWDRLVTSLEDRRA